LSKIENQIIEFLSEPGYRPIDSGALSKKLGVTKRNMKTFRSTIGTLVDEGRIREGKKGRL